MHPAIIRQLAADHIREMHMKAEDKRLGRRAHRARRRAPSTRPGPAASGTLSYDDPRLAAGQRAATREHPSCRIRPGRGQHLRQWEQRSACVAAGD